MIILIDGLFGSGKTLLATALGKSYSDYFCCPLNSNITIDKKAPITSKDHLKRLSDCILVWDEIHNDQDSRNTVKNISLSHYILQIRKKNVLTICTTQHIDQVDKRVRNNTFQYIHATKGSGNIFIYDVYSLITNRFLRRVRIDGTDFFQYYNTREFINELT